MKEQEAMIYGGDILGEIEECDKLVSDSEQVVMYGTQTAICHAFLTIYCC